MDFRKAFDTIPREWLLERLKSLEIPNDIIWAIYALYEQVSGYISVEYERIMAVFTLSLWIVQVWAISVNSIKGSCPRIVTI